MNIRASSPTKIIIAGEHAVVHGCTAIAVPLEARNVVSVEPVEGKTVVMKPHAKEGVDPAIAEKTQKALQAVFDFVQPSQGILFDRDFSGMPKGSGNSASIASAFAFCLYAMDGKSPSTDELFNAAQEFEKVMHVNPSGIDARTVLSDSALIMKKRWVEGQAQFDFKHKHLSLPTGTQLLVIDRSALGEKTMTTGELVTLFSQTLVGKNPNDVTQDERDDMIYPFEPVVEKIISELHENGNAHELGKLFHENNSLLEQGGVVPAGMKKTVEECVEAGCLGAKGTGACGPGGSVIALAWEKDVHAITKRLEAKKLKIIPAKFAVQGTRLE